MMIHVTALSGNGMYVGTSTNMLQWDEERRALT